MFKKNKKTLVNHSVHSSQLTVLSHTERKDFCDTDSIEAASLWPTPKMGPLNSYTFCGKLDGEEGEVIVYTRLSSL